LDVDPENEDEKGPRFRTANRGGADIFFDLFCIDMFTIQIYFLKINFKIEIIFVFKKSSKIHKILKNLP